MTRLIALAGLVMLLSGGLHAGIVPSPTGPGAPLTFPSDSARVDSLPHTPTHRLLPANMSFMERGLWGEDGFLRNVGIASPLTPEVRKTELGLRRTMLTAHQIGGFVTLGLMVSAVYTGQKVLNGDPAFRNTHQSLVLGTIISYSVTGALAILSPPPSIRRDEVSTITIHKTLAWVHFAGMILTPILGAAIHRNSTASKERFHQVSAYITTATFAASMIVVTF